MAGEFDAYWDAVDVILQESGQDTPDEDRLLRLFNDGLTPEEAAEQLMMAHGEAPEPAAPHSNGAPPPEPVTVSDSFPLQGLVDALQMHAQLTGEVVAGLMALHGKVDALPAAWHLGEAGTVVLLVGKPMSLEDAETWAAELTKREHVEVTLHNAVSGRVVRTFAAKPPRRGRTES